MQRGGEPLLVAVHRLVVLHELLVEHVQDRLAGDVGDVGGAASRGAAEGAQCRARRCSLRWKVTPMCSRCRTSLGRLAAHDLDGVLVAQEVRALDRVVGVRRASRRSGLIAALMPPAAATECERTGWTLLRIATVAPASGGGQGGALAGEAGADDQDVVVRAWSVGAVIRMPSADAAERAVERRPSDACRQRVRRRRWPAAAGGVSARRTCSTVTTPRRRRRRRPP